MEKSVSTLLRLLFLCLLVLAAKASGDDQLVYSGFTGANLTLDGAATVTPEGLLELTNGTDQQKGHAFYPTPLRFAGGSPGGSAVRSFSASFVFAIQSIYTDLSAHGMAFVVASSTNFSSALPGQLLGLTDVQNNGNGSNHFFAVELDTIQNKEFDDLDANHAGANVNGLRSLQSYYAGYFDDDDGSFRNLSLISREAMQVWVDYDHRVAQITVTMAPLNVGRPVRPLFTATYNLTTAVTDVAYVGFSSATGTINVRHYVLGWSFAMNGPAPAIDISKLPKLPRMGPKPRSKVLDIVLPIASGAFVLSMGAIVLLVLRRRFRYAELREDWEVEFGPQRFSYKDLYCATEGFSDTHLLGIGGFGRVYKGILPVSTRMEVAVKRLHTTRSRASKNSFQRLSA
uniref:non-specific serine/threonine protein kinase n=1 Tax=Triticum urartu TaxID=4572 RepID=A0A8R7PQ00_TRIUA